MIGNRRRFQVFQSKESDCARLSFLLNGVDVAIIRLETLGDGGDMSFVLVRKSFEEACLPDMGKLVHLSFYTVSQSIVIRQAPKFPVIGKNDFRIAEC